MKIIITLLFFFALNTFSYALTVDEILNSVGLDVVSEYREEDNPGEFFVGYKFKEKFPEFNIEIRKNYINIAWYEEDENLENSENFKLTSSVLKYILEDDSVLASLKLGENIRDKEISGYKVSAMKSGSIFYVIKIDGINL